MSPASTAASASRPSPTSPGDERPSAEEVAPSSEKRSLEDSREQWADAGLPDDSAPEEDEEEEEDDEELFAFEGVLYLRTGDGSVTETETGDENRVGTWDGAKIVFGNESAERAHRRHTDYRPVKKARLVLAGGELKTAKSTGIDDASLVTPTTCVCQPRVAVELRARIVCARSRSDAAYWSQVWRRGTYPPRPIGAHVLTRGRGR